FDLSPSTTAALIGEFIRALNLTRVTLVENDAGRAQTYAATRPPEVDRLALISCEALNNYPPGLPGKLVALSARLPGGLNAMAQPLRFRFMRRLPVALGLMSKRKVPDEITDRWLSPILNQPAIRKDLIRYLRAVDKNEMTEAAQKLKSFEKPALVIWAEEDKVMPIETGRRLAAALPRADFKTIADSYTLIPEDQPEELASMLRAFIENSHDPSQR
ncbi:MAG: alpha/beta hydrolase, partial [Myxococcota bacterium]